MKNRNILLIGFLFCTLRLFAQTEYTVNLYDAQRERIVPIAIYEPKHSGNWCHGNPHNWSSSYRMQHHMDCLSLQEPCHGVLHQWCPFRSSGGIVPVGAGYVSLRWANADVVWDNLEF